MSRPARALVLTLVLTLSLLPATPAQGPQTATHQADEPPGPTPTPPTHPEPDGDPAGPAEEDPCSAPTPRPLLEPERPHPPIRIDGHHPHQGFTLDRPGGDPVYRPGAGVVAGNGTAANPYVIGGWSTTRIVLENTSAHVRVQQNAIRVPGPQDRAPAAPEPLQAALVEVRDAENVTIADNLVDRRHRNLRIGHGTTFVTDTVRIEDSRDVAVVDNHLRRDDRLDQDQGTFPVPLHVVESRDVCLEGNAMDTEPKTWQGAIRIEDSSRVVVRDHDLHPLRVRVVDSWGVTLADNTLGLTRLRSSPHAVLAGNAWPPTEENATRWAADESVPDAVLVVSGSRARDWDHEIAASNTVDGAPLRYVSGAEDTTVDRPAGQVMVHNATNVTVEDQVFTAPFSAGFASDVRLRNVTFRDIEVIRGLLVDSVGVWGQNVSGLAVEDSRFEHAAVAVQDSAGLRVVNSTMRGSDASVEAVESRKMVVAGNRFPDVVSHCVRFIDSSHGEVTGNRCLGVSRAVIVNPGVSAEGVPHNFTVRNNTMSGPSIGVGFEAHNGEARNVTVVDNNFTGFGDAVVVRYPAEVHGNNFVEVLRGVNDWDNAGEEIDARRNWWGCPEGPEGEDADCADFEGRVNFDDWLEALNPEAGADDG